MEAPDLPLPHPPMVGVGPMINGPMTLPRLARERAFLSGLAVAPNFPRPHSALVLDVSISSAMQTGTMKHDTG